MLIRFIRGWREQYHAGQVVDFPDGMCVELVRRGVAEIELASVEDTPPYVPAPPADKPAAEPRRTTQTKDRNRRAS